MDVFLPCGDEKVESDAGVPPEPSSPCSCFWRSAGGGSAEQHQRWRRGGKEQGMGGHASPPWWDGSVLGDHGGYTSESCVGWNTSRSPAGHPTCPALSASGDMEDAPGIASASLCPREGAGMLLGRAFLESYNTMGPKTWDFSIPSKSPLCFIITCGYSCYSCK